MGGNFVFGLLLLSVALVRAQEYIAWQEPETDIWDEYSNPNSVPNEQLFELCKKYHLSINNNQIDCSDIQLQLKQDDIHIIHKREADDVQLEGSGNGESGQPEISLVSENNEGVAVEIPVAVNASDTQIVEDQEPVAAQETPDKPEAVAESPLNSESDKVQPAVEQSDKAPEVAAVKPASEESDKVEVLAAKAEDAAEGAAVKSEVGSVPEETAPVEHSEEESPNAVDPPIAESVPEKAAPVEPSEPESPNAVDPPEPEKTAPLEPSEAESPNAVDPPALESVAEKPAPVASSEAESPNAVDPPAPESVPEETAPVVPSGKESPNAVDPPAPESVPEETAPVVPSAEESPNAIDPPAAEIIPEETAAVKPSETESHDAQEEAAVDPAVAKSVPEASPVAEPSDNNQEESVAKPLEPVVEPSEAESPNAREESSAVEPAEVQPKAPQEQPSEAQNAQEAAVDPSETQPDNIPEVSVIIAAVDNDQEKSEAELQKVPELPESNPSNSDAIGQIFDTVAKETENKPVEEAKIEQKVLPSDLAEAEITLKQPEIIDEKQSGNAVLFKQPKTVGSISAVEGSDSDKHLASLASNEESKNQSVESEQPSTGESAKTVSKAGKDTTILIVLFVVVLVIGGAAFTHHVVKMRRAKRAETSSVVDGIRKSLQNLAGNGKSPTPDVEQGTEMKPLMNLNSNNSGPVMVKEYSDKKKDVEA